VESESYVSKTNTRLLVVSLNPSHRYWLLEATVKASDEKTRRRRRHVEQIRARSGKTTLIAPDASTAANAPRALIVDYDQKNCNESETETLDACSSYLQTPTVTWFNVKGDSTASLLDVVERVFGVNQLTLSHVTKTGQRPRVDIFDAYISITLESFKYNDATRLVESESVSIIFGEHYVLTFSRDDSSFATVKELVYANEERIRAAGPDYLAMKIVDAIIDQYFTILEKLGERIEAVEEDVVASATSQTLDEIHALKTELTYFRDAVWPLREAVERLSEADTSLIEAQTRPYLRDLYERTVNTIDIIETLRDIVSGVLDIYLSRVSLKMNEVMKVLTIIGTIFLPLAFIASVYGMNFREPEVALEWGYPAFWLVSAVIVIGMVLYFRRAGWLLAPHDRKELKEQTR
jgi:magnesium transporter